MFVINIMACMFVCHALFDYEPLYMESVIRDCIYQETCGVPSSICLAISLSLISSINVRATSFFLRDGPALASSGHFSLTVY